MGALLCSQITAACSGSTAPGKRVISSPSECEDCCSYGNLPGRRRAQLHHWCCWSVLRHHLGGKELLHYQILDAQAIVFLSESSSRHPLNVYSVSCCRAWQLALCSCALRLLLRRESSEECASMGSIEDCMCVDRK